MGYTQTDIQEALDADRKSPLRVWMTLEQAQNPEEDGILEVLREHNRHMQAICEELGK